VIDFEYVISDVGRRNLFADYFGDLHFLAEDVIRVESVTRCSCKRNGRSITTSRAFGPWRFREAALGARSSTMARQGSPEGRARARYAGMDEAGGVSSRLHIQELGRT